MEVTEDGYVVPEYTPEEYEVPGDDVNRLMSGETDDGNVNYS